MVDLPWGNGKQLTVRSISINNYSLESIAFSIDNLSAALLQGSEYSDVLDGLE